MAWQTRASRTVYENRWILDGESIAALAFAGVHLGRFT